MKRIVKVEIKKINKKEADKIRDVLKQAILSSRESFKVSNTDSSRDMISKHSRLPKKVVINRSIIKSKLSKKKIWLDETYIISRRNLKKILKKKMVKRLVKVTYKESNQMGMGR